MFKKSIIFALLLCLFSISAFAQPPHHSPPDHRPGQHHHRYSVDIRANHGGYVSPRGHVVVNHGSNLLIKIRPDRGHVIRRVVIDGRNIGPVREYRFRNINRSHNVHVEFAPAHHGNPHQR